MLYLAFVKIWYQEHQRTSLEHVVTSLAFRDVAVIPEVAWLYALSIARIANSIWLWFGNASSLRFPKCEFPSLSTHLPCLTTGIELFCRLSTSVLSVTSSFGFAKNIFIQINSKQKHLCFSRSAYY